MNRRQFLLGGLGLAAAATTMGLTGCAPGSSNTGGGGGGDASSAELAFTWWGNDVRNKNTTNAITAYTTANPGVKIAPQPGEWSSYWDKLATQVAGNTAPDIIQMDMAYISEYGNREALLDLSGVDTSKFIEGTVDSGKINDTLYGINAGFNCLVNLANPKVFEKAGMEVPDDKTWTWDSLIDVSAEVAAKAKLSFGFQGLVHSNLFEAWIRQQGKTLFTADGLGYEAGDVQGWFDYLVKAQKAGAIGTPAGINEEEGKSLDQSAIVLGKAALSLSNSNQLEAISTAAGTDLGLLRYPTISGDVAQRNAWYKASMLWSASARTKNPDAVVAFINWLVNTPEAGEQLLAERGMPANSEVQEAVLPKLSKSQQTVQQFLIDIRPELGETPIAPPPGGGKTQEVMFRYSTEVLFGRQSSAEAAQKYIDEMKSNLQG
ncbi:MAG: extracellular solute-binding protein [Propionibacteriaceae bacterium]